MTAGDRAFERAAQKLESAADRAAASGGLKAKVADELTEDAQFLRKLKPSLVAARIRGEQPPEDRATAPKARRPPATASKKKLAGGGPSPIVIAAGGLVVGVLLAKVIDWRSHAHPRR
jgi:hypothetical protein